MTNETKGQGNPGTVVDKLNGGTDHKILDYTDELARLDYINPSTILSERVNKPEEINTQLTQAQTQLEALIEKEVGGATAIITNKDVVDKVIESLVSQDAHLTDAKTDAKKREQEVHEYLTRAGVEYSALLRNTIGLRGGLKVEQLPEGHPLRQLISYIASKKVPNADRKNFVQRYLLSVGAAKPSALAEAINKIAGTNLDTSVATPQESLSAYNAQVQAKLALYRANDPNVVYNKKAA